MVSVVDSESGAVEWRLRWEVAMEVKLDDLKFLGVALKRVYGGDRRGL